MRWNTFAARCDAVRSLGAEVFGAALACYAVATNNIAFAEATPRHRLLAIAAAMAIVLVAFASAPLSDGKPHEVPASLAAVGAIAVFAQMLTALLLATQYGASRYTPILVLGVAYASAGVLLVAYVLTFAHVFGPGGLLGAGPQTAAWLYFARHALFAVLMLVYVYFERYTTLKLLSRERERIGLTNLAWSVAVVTIAIIVVTTRFHEFLPQVVSGNRETELAHRLVVPWLLGLYGLVLFVLAATTRLRAVAQLCVALVVLASLFELLVKSVFATAHFTAAWYLGWLECIIAASLLLCVLLYQVYQLTLELAATNRALLKQAMADDLTGLLNRRGFNASLEDQWHRSRRRRQSVCLLMLDVDEFKRFNDQWGHPKGDAALVSVADVLRTFTRNATDSASRLGGEEFGVILGDTDEPGGLAVAERIRRAVERLQLPQAAGTEHPYLTVSIGLAAAEDDFGPSPADLTLLADQALYAAKAAGRNCTRTAAEHDVALRRGRMRAAQRLSG